jgi:tRNA threonylcarbamoyl adenosine modification protein YeaZ
MHILALDSALARCSAGIVVDGELAASRQQDVARGHAALLPDMTAEVLAEAGVPADGLDFVAVTVGPGSFTGVRAGLALAHGVALPAGLQVVGVTVGEALADALPHLGGRGFWSAIDSRRGRVFIEHDGAVAAHVLDALPLPAGRVAVGGDAAIAVAGRLAARGADVMLTDARLPLVRHVAMAGLARWTGALPPRSAQPLYVDAPEAKLPAGGLRPPPTTP